MDEKAHAHRTLSSEIDQLSQKLMCRVANLLPFERSRRITAMAEEKELRVGSRRLEQSL